MKFPTTTLESVLSLCDSGEWGDDPVGGNGIPVIRVADVKAGNRILFDTAPLRNVPLKKRAEKTVRNGDILVVKSSGSGTRVVSGRVAQVSGIEDGEYGFANFLLRLRADSTKYTARFLLYVLSSPKVREQVLTIVGATTYPNLSVPAYRRIIIPNPTLAEQERIVKLLDEADELRKLRALADQRTADLIPSLFHDMFGPDAPGPTTWQTATVAELAAAHDGSIRTGPFGSDLRHSEFVEEGIPVLGIDNVVENEFRWTKSRCIPKTKFAEMKRFVVFPGDVLVTIMGTVGRCSIAPEELPVCISTKHLCTVTLNRTKVHPRFIWGAFLHDASVKQQTRSVGKGAIMEGWNSTIIKRIRLRVPPLSLQKEFAAHVSEIRGMQTEQAASRRRLDELFQSILHRAFRGEL